MTPRQEAEAAVLRATILQNPFVPEGHREPHPKQARFLVDPRPEVLFGGSVGGGKSSALLLAALQFVDVPGYAALILRRTYQDLALPDAIMDRAIQWLRPHPAVKWNADTKTFTFPSGATISFGYLQSREDHLRYQGAALQAVLWDELTQFPDERQYRYLFSRLRRLEGFKVPLRMRAASNPGGPGHCLPRGDVLTPSGWKPIQAFVVGDPVFSVAADGTMVECRVDQVHRRHYLGEMVSVDARGFRMECTPNHSVAKVGGIRSDACRAFALVSFEDLPGQATILRSVSWRGRAAGPFRIPPATTRKRKGIGQPGEVSERDFAEFMGWFLSEGCTVDRDKAFSIAQQKEPQRMQIGCLLDRMGFKWRWNGPQAVVYSVEWWEYLRQFGKCREKFVPSRIREAPFDVLQSFLVAVMDGDGFWRSRPRSGDFYTTSGRLADDVQEIALKLGKVTFLSSRQREDRDGLSYCVSFKEVKCGGTEILTGQHVYDVATSTRRRSHIERRPFDGFVYCLGIEGTHTFVVRQGGSAWVSGNSWVKQRFIDSCEPDRGFLPSRLADNPSLDQAEYLAALGHLDPVTRRQLVEGDWNARREGGLFRREWFAIEDEVPELVAIVRWWDLAAGGGDWSVGLKAGVDRQRRIHVLDVRRVDVAPADVERVVAGVAASDGLEVAVYFGEEPGSAGKSLVDHYRRNVIPSVRVEGVRETGAKFVRAQPCAGQAHAGNIRLVRGPWVEAFLDELEAFTERESEYANDDQVDSLSGAYSRLVEVPIRTDRHRPPDPQDEFAREVGWQPTRTGFFG